VVERTGPMLPGAWRDGTVVMGPCNLETGLSETRSSSENPGPLLLGPQVRTSRRRALCAYHLHVVSSAQLRVYNGTATLHELAHRR
jgi:hypothetical protein